MNDYKQVEAIFRKGFDAGAKPKDELEQAHHAFGISMSKRLLYDDDGSKKEFQARMEEKRSALTSLHAHKKKFVGSLRTGIAVRDENPGVVNQENIPTLGNVKPTDVHEDDQQGAVALPANTSVIRSIIDSARKKENAHEPGPWTKARTGKHGSLFDKAAELHQPCFNIMEDDNITPLPCPVNNFKSGVQLPPGHVFKNGCQKPWNVPIFVEEPVVPGAIPCYEKFLLYPNVSTEISADEYRAYKWFKDRGMAAPVTRSYENIWTNKFENNIRIPPGFVDKSTKQEKFSTELFIDSGEVSGFQLPFKGMYPGNGEVFSFEELKFKSNNFKLVTDDDFEEVNLSDMEMTMIGDRRHSIYPVSRKSFVPRKSIVPRKSMMPMKEVEEEDEEEEEEEPVKKIQFEDSLGAIRKRKMNEELEENRPQLKREWVAETPPRNVFEKKKDSDIFKPPAPVERKSIKPYPFELPDDESGGNDTCSTMQFNFFLKAQSVSTPVSKKTVPRLVPLENEEEKHAEPVNDTPLPLEKQLSTIMETTETTQSTKSSVSSDETDLNPKTPNYQRDSEEREIMQQEIEKRVFNPLLASFRLPEDQTETCSKIQPMMMHRIAEANLTQAKMAMSMKAIDFAEPAFEIYEDEKDESMKMPDELEVKDISMNMPEEDLKAKEESFKLLEKENNVSVNIPETQEVDSSPETQEVPEMSFGLSKVPQTSFTIPATQEIDATFEIETVSAPGTKEVPQKTDFEIPEDFDIPATQDFEVPTENSPIAFKSPPKPTNESNFFNIYEDSVREPTRSRINIPDDEGTGFLHISRKENLLVQPKRTPSDEFLDLLASPGVTVKNVGKNEESDFLKFSGTEGSLETSLKRLSLDQPKCATPTNFFDEDFNTEKFSLALGNLKNSTLIIDVKKPTNCFDALNLSVAMNENEFERLEATAGFKVPIVPPPKQIAQKIDFHEDADDDEMGKSIYVPRPELTDDSSEWNEEEVMGSFLVDAFNKYEHTIIGEADLSLKVQQAMANANGNPFNEELREAMLEHCNFTVYLESHVKTCTLVKKLPQLKPGMLVETGNDEFSIKKFIARGSFASVFAAKNVKTEKFVAMKQEKPANLWEYYICVELADRCKNKAMLSAFMNIEAAVIGNNSSVFVTKLSTQGSLIDVCNMHKNAINKNVDEYVVMVLTTQLLSIIDHLHGCKIIHGDIKPDNFVLMSK